MALTLEQELALLALLSEKKNTLSELPAATGLGADDLMLTRQGIIDKSITGEVLKRYVTPSAASLTTSGLTKLSNAVNSNAEDIAATPKAVKVAYDLAGRALEKESNLADLTNVADALTNLGLGDSVGYVGRFLNVQIFDSSGTYTPTIGTKKIIVEAIGGGGASGGVGASMVARVSISGCGTNGAYAKVLIEIVSPTSIIIGAGGSGVINYKGNDGGATSFGSYFMCPGGVGAPAGQTNIAPDTIYNTGTNAPEAPQPIINNGLVIKTMTSSPTVTCAISLGYGSALLCNPPFTHIGGGYGIGGRSVYLTQNMPAQAGFSGRSGRVIVWEYA